MAKRELIDRFNRIWGKIMKKHIDLIMTLILFLFVIALTFFRHDIGRWEFVFHLTVWSISFFIQGFLLEKKPQKGTMVIHVDNAIKEMKNLNAGELEIAATHIRGDKTYKTTTIIRLEETDETEDDNDET
jgi:hypothetical protein